MTVGIGRSVGIGFGGFTGLIMTATGGGVVGIGVKVGTTVGRGLGKRAIIEAIDGSFTSLKVAVSLWLRSLERNKLEITTKETGIIQRYFLIKKRQSTTPPQKRK